MGMESMNSNEKAAKALQEATGNNDFLEKYKNVKDHLGDYDEAGRELEEKLAKVEQRKKDDGVKIEEIRGSLGLPPKEDSDLEEEKKYVDIKNEKTGRNILFSKEDIENGKKELEEEKYIEIKNEKTGRGILFSKDDIENGKKQLETENLLKVPNELANTLKQEEKILASIHSQIERTQSDLEKFKDSKYIDTVTDQYGTGNAEYAGTELRSEYESLEKKLADLQFAENKTVEEIKIVQAKLSQ